MKGRVTIGRFTGSSEGVRIEFTDESSRVRFATATLTVEDFGRAITGLGEIDCEIETRNLHLVGTMAENKTEVIKVERPFGSSELFDRLKTAVSNLEVDGWKHRESDLKNHHNYKSDGIHVTFFRHVRKADSEER